MGMVNFHDPAVIEKDFSVLIKLWHILIGLYVWEFLTALEYDWNVFRGRIPYRWTIWIYTLARVAALFVVLLCFFLLDDRNPVNCQAVSSFVNALSFLAMSASSLLIVLRAIAIWDKKRVVMVTTIGLWVFNVATLVQGVVRLHVAWTPSERKCVPHDIHLTVLCFIIFLVTDIALLFIMLVGLFRLRRHVGGTCVMTQFLWRQGVIWILLATAAEVLPVVLLVLNLNDQLDLMFLLPSCIAMTIAATRLHRSLVGFAHEFTDSAHEKPEDTNPPIPKTTRIRASSTPLNRMEVVVHVFSKQHPSPQMGDEDSRIDMYEHDKPNELRPDDNVEQDV